MPKLKIQFTRSTIRNTYHWNLESKTKMKYWTVSSSSCQTSPLQSFSESNSTTDNQYHLFIAFASTFSLHRLTTTDIPVWSKINVVFVLWSCVYIASTFSNSGLEIK